VKKYLIFIFIGLICLPAFSNAGKIINDGPIHPSRQDVYTDASIHLSHSELEISTARAGNGTHFWQVAKKVIGNKDLVANQQVSFFSAQFPGSRALRFLYAKTYLLHIYPSHNFW
jgi:hypothetical protein